MNIEYFIDDETNKMIAENRTKLVTPEFVMNFKLRVKNFFIRNKVDSDLFHSKLKSEIISGLFEAELKDTYKNIETPHIDSMPDIILNGNEFIEGKTTSTDTWRGGSYSKRAGYFFLINWRQKNEDYSFFIAGTELTEEDWKVVDKNDDKKYYATGFSKKDLADRKVDIYCGDIEKYRRGSLNCVRITQA